MSAEHGERPIVVGETHYLVVRGDRKPLIGLFGVRNPDKGPLTVESAARGLLLSLGKVKITTEHYLWGYENYYDGYVGIESTGEAYLELVDESLRTSREPLTEKSFDEVFGYPELREKLRLERR